MNVKQVNTLINSVVNQMNGTEDVTATDLTDVIQLGKENYENEKWRDNFCNVLVDRIGKTIISQRAYAGVDSAIISDAFEFGAILQKIYVDPMEAVESKVWGLTEGGSVDPFKITKPAVKQWLFNGIDTWQVDITIPDIQWKSAWDGPEQMAAFVDAIFVTLSNSIELHLESIANMAYANFIGEKLADAFGYTGGSASSPEVTPPHNPGQVINLLAEYKGINPSAMFSAKEAYLNEDFLIYASQRINTVLKRMSKMSTMFNCTDYQRHTPIEYARVTMLNDFAMACQYNMRSKVFNEELVRLPNYREVQYWQGSGKDYDLSDTSHIEITTASGKVVNQSGIVCLINDVEAIALTHQLQTVESIRNPKGKYTNYFNSVDIGYLNDITENGVVFIICDTEDVNTVYTKDYA